LKHRTMKLNEINAATPPEQKPWA